MVKILFSAVLLVVAVIAYFKLVANDDRTAQPSSIKRPDAVPEGAVAAIGPDGGSWVNCEYTSFPELYCETYFSSNGAIWTRGKYILNSESAAASDTDEIPIDQLMKNFSLFDGINIHLGQNTKLIPDGPIESPLGDKGGKVTVYSNGEIVEPEKLY